MTNDDTKGNLRARIRRIAGQLEGVARMVEEDRASPDILLQIASAQAALSQVGKVVLRSHVESCLRNAVASSQPRERNQKIDELVEVFARYGSSGKGSLG